MVRGTGQSTQPQQLDEQEVVRGEEGGRERREGGREGEEGGRE